MCKTVAVSVKFVEVGVMEVIFSGFMVGRRRGCVGGMSVRAFGGSYSEGSYLYEYE